MPTPIGHVLAGVAVAWSTDLLPRTHAGRTAPPDASLYQRAGGSLTLLCAGLAVLPDVDLAFVAHRTVTHSIGAVAFVALAAAATAAAAGHRSLRMALMCAAAYGSHLLLDWLGVDRYFPYGLQALWPLTSTWYISGVDLFRQTARQHLFTRAVMIVDAQAIAQEVAILGPIVVALWLARVRVLATVDRRRRSVSATSHPRV